VDGGASFPLGVGSPSLVLAEGTTDDKACASDVHPIKSR
jgi:hypothetical protein